MNRYNPKCSNCKAKSADCAYGDLEGSESCKDAIENSLRKDNMLEYSKERIVDAIDYLEDFNQFAKKRMFALQRDIELALSGSSYITRCESIEIRIDTLMDDVLQAIMWFGFHSSGHGETLCLPLNIITLPDAEWDIYCKDRIQSEIDKKNAKNQQESQKDKDRRKEQYLKLREEFESVDSGE